MFFLSHDSKVSIIIRTVLFHDAIKQIGLTDLDNVENLILQREGLLGKEMFFSGDVRQNSYFNNSELILDGADEIDLDELMGKLEKT